MDAATTKQKTYIKDLFIQSGVPKPVFSPLELWNISKRDASSLINDLLALKKFHHGDLKDIICQSPQGKNIFQETVKTVDELEEEAGKQATYNLTSEDWLGQHIKRIYQQDTPKKTDEVLLQYHKLLLDREIKTNEVLLERD